MAAVAFESLSLSKLAQSLTGHPRAPVRISVHSRGAIFLQDNDVELNLFILCDCRKANPKRRSLMDLNSELESQTLGLSRWKPAREVFHFEKSKNYAVCYTTSLPCVELLSLFGSVMIG